MNIIITRHLVRKGDLNHHDSLYAGRSADWLVETAFITAESLLASNSIVAAKINEVCYLKPVYAGEVIVFNGEGVYAGSSSLIIYVHGNVHGEKVIEGFITVVHVDENGHSKPHGVHLDDVDSALLDRAKKLREC